MSHLRIAIDAKLAATPYMGGASRYIQHLIEGLVEIDTENEYYIYLDSHHKFEGIKEATNFTVRVLNMFDRQYSNLIRDHTWIPSLYRFGFYEQILLPTYLQRDRIDLFHSTQNALPISKVCKSIVTAHYLTPILHPESARGSLSMKLFNTLYKVFTPRFVSRADAIIAVGKSVGDDVTRVYNYPKDKVFVIPPAVNKIFRPIEQHEKNAVMKKYNVSNDFILCFDSASFHDELGCLLEAFVKLKVERRIHHKLVIGGNLPIPYSNLLRSFVRRNSLENEIVFTGFVSDADLVRLYNAAAVFVYPTTHEGFGIMPLEAMSCGTPVIAITSTATMIKEMVGDAGTVVDPSDMHGLAELLHRILTDRDLHLSMRSRSLMKAEMFNWKTIAQNTLRVYNEVLRS